MKKVKIYWTSFAEQSLSSVERYIAEESGSENLAHRYGFNGMEKDDEIKGSGNSYDFGARLYDARLGRWLAVDPLAMKYPGLAPFVFAANTPLIAMDKDGRDVVWFNQAGREVARLITDERFETYVYNNEGFATKAPMPKIIKGYELPKYQQYDYNIAAQTFLFNEKLAGDKDLLPTFSDNHKLASDAKSPTPLDPTLVKAISIEESQAGTYAGGMGTGTNDPMQMNNSGDEAGKEAVLPWNLTGDWAKVNKITPNESFKYGIDWLYLKGNKSDSKGNMSWRSSDGSWNKAVTNYNGSDRKAEYSKEVFNFMNSASEPKRENYVEITPETK